MFHSVRTFKQYSQQQESDASASMYATERRIPLSYASKLYGDSFNTILADAAICWLCQRFSMPC